MLLLLGELKRIEDIEQGDSEHILNETISVFKNFLNKKHDLSSRENREQLISALLQLQEQHRENMMLFHFLNNFLLEWEKHGIAFFESEGLKFVEEYEKKWQDFTNKFAAAALNYIDFKDKTILLHGENELIIRLFELLAEKKFKVNIIQTEYRPREEGKEQAERLLDLNFNIKYIADAAVGKMMKNADIVLMEADSIFLDFFNAKIGTFPIALAAEYYKKPLFVLADSRKVVVNKNLPPFLKKTLLTEEEKPGEELWDEPYPNVEPVNYYYERTPNTFVKEFVLELGAFTPEELNKYFEQSKISSCFDQKYF